MKLELNIKEMEEILLEWAEQKWPGQFNVIELTKERYGSGIVGVEFTKAVEKANEGEE